MNKSEKRKVKLPEGIPLKTFEEMTIGEIRKLNKQYNKLMKGGNK